MPKRLVTSIHCFVTVVTFHGPLATTRAKPVFSVPNAPSGLWLGGMAAFDTYLALGFSWTDNSDNETGFRIEQKQGVNGSGNTRVLTQPTLEE